MCVYAYTYACACGCQRTIYGSHLSPSTMWVSRTERRVSGLPATPLSTESSHQHEEHILTTRPIHLVR